MGLESHEHNRPDRQVNLVCRFKAKTGHGRAYTIEGWAGFPNGECEPSQIEFRTADGAEIHRLAKGKYCLSQRPDTQLTSDDPAAP